MDRGFIKVLTHFIDRNVSCKLKRVSTRYCLVHDSGWEESKIGIEEDVFDAFFARLREDEGFSSEIVEKLRQLWESNDIASKERILHILREEIKDASEGKSD